MVKNPALRHCPLGIQQKNIIVTSNYVAREYGIQKCMLVSEGLRLCPQLVLVRGEDLYDYRQMSTKITSLLHRFSPLVEKLGLDENFVDVTDLVAERLVNSTNQESVDGCVYGDLNEKCECGCMNRLCVGSYIAGEMRREIFDVLGITSCAGIAHNKLLAKMVCATHKPNQQTTVFPSSSLALVSCLQNVRSIPGIGHHMHESLQLLGISSVTDLQNYNRSSLQKALGNDMAIKIKKLCYGIDDSPVKQTGKPQSIGLEDGFMKICLESEVRDKLYTLLQRLLKLLFQDGRIPGSVRVTVRKYDNTLKHSHRVSRQCNITASIFRNDASQNRNERISPKSKERLMALIMQLFHKMVDISKPFHLTLVGLAFTKFQECKTGKSSIASFLTNDISVQSVLSFKSAISEAEKMEYSCVNSSPCISMGKSGSESEPEPSPKKSRTGCRFAQSKKRFSSEDDFAPNKRISEDSSSDSVDGAMWEDSESKSNEQEQSTSSGIIGTASLDSQMNSCSSSDVMHDVADEKFQCPHNVDADVFYALPHELKKELMDTWRMERNKTSPVSQSKQVTLPAKPKQKSILQYFISNE
jgi:DNA polymerase iota